MKKKSTKAASTSRAVSKRMISIKDLKAKHTESVKGGGASVTGGFDISKRH